MRLKLAAMLPLVISLSASIAPQAACAMPRVGLTVAIPDIPHIVSGEVDLIFNPMFTLGFNFGGFAYTFATQPNSTPVSILDGNIRARWHPFSGVFFLGLIGGLQRVAGSQSGNYTITDPVLGTPVAIPASGGVSILSPHLTPHLGWIFTTNSGFTFGIELGVQVPVRSTSSVSISIDDPAYTPYVELVQATQSYKDAQAQIEDTASKIGNIPLPYFVLRWGWTF